MFGRLLPKEGRFFDLFNAHAAQVVRAATELSALMHDYSQLEERARIIDEAEHAADRITAETIRLLHQTFITPLDRDHIHQLVNGIDDICDLVQDTTQSLSLYDIRKITPETERLADISAKCCERVKEVVALLGDKEGRFEAIVKTCEEIDRLESDADRVMRLEHAPRHHSRDGISRVVQAVEEIECQRERHQEHERREADLEAAHRGVTPSRSRCLRRGSPRTGSGR